MAEYSLRTVSNVVLAIAGLALFAIGTVAPDVGKTVVIGGFVGLAIVLFVAGYALGQPWYAAGGWLSPLAVAVSIAIASEGEYRLLGLLFVALPIVDTAFQPLYSHLTELGERFGS